MTQPLPYPTAIRNAKACETLLLLLEDAIADLHRLGDDPVIVASCPARFNDVRNDVDWRAIRSGPFFSERQDDTERPEAHDKRLREGPPSARAANLVLERLERAGWRRLYQETFDREYVSPEEVIALVIQHGKEWLVLCDSFNGQSAVYAPTKGLVQVGYCDGSKPFDRCLGELSPLTVREQFEHEAHDHSAALAPTEIK